MDGDLNGDVWTPWTGTPLCLADARSSSDGKNKERPPRVLTCTSTHGQTQSEVCDNMRAVRSMARTT